MSNKEKKKLSFIIKQWLFEYITTSDIYKVTTPYLVILLTFLELSILHFFYIHQSFSFLKRLSLFQQYFDNSQQFFVLLMPFTNPIFSLLLLTFYPLCMLVLFIIKKTGPFKPLVILIQAAAFFFPLISIKMVLEVLEGFKTGEWIFLKVPLGLITMVFGAIILTLTGRLHRLVEIPLVILLFFGAN